MSSSHQRRIRVGSPACGLRWAARSGMALHPKDFNSQCGRALAALFSLSSFPILVAWPARFRCRLIQESVAYNRAGDLAIPRPIELHPAIARSRYALRADQPRYPFPVLIDRPRQDRSSETPQTHCPLQNAIRELTCRLGQPGFERPRGFLEPVRGPPRSTRRLGAPRVIVGSTRRKRVPECPRDDSRRRRRTVRCRLQHPAISRSGRMLLDRSSEFSGKRDVEPSVTINDLGDVNMTTPDDLAGGGPGGHQCLERIEGQPGDG